MNLRDLPPDEALLEIMRGPPVRGKIGGNYDRVRKVFTLRLDGRKMEVTRAELLRWIKAVLVEMGEAGTLCQVEQMIMDFREAA